MASGKEGITLQEHRATAENVHQSHPVQGNPQAAAMKPNIRHCRPPEGASCGCADCDVTTNILGKTATPARYDNRPHTPRGDLERHSHGPGHDPRSVEYDEQTPECQQVVRLQPTQVVYIAKHAPVYQASEQTFQSGMMAPGNWLACLAGSATLEIQQVRAGFGSWEYQIYDCASRQPIMGANYNPECSCGFGSGQRLDFNDMSGVTVLQIVDIFKMCQKYVDVMFPIGTRIATVSIANWLGTAFEVMDVHDRLTFRIVMDGRAGWTKTCFTVTDASGYVVGKFVFRTAISGSTVQFVLPIAPEAKAIILAGVFYVLLLRLAS